MEPPEKSGAVDVPRFLKKTVPPPYSPVKISRSPSSSMSINLGEAFP